MLLMQYLTFGVKCGIIRVVWGYFDILEVLCMTKVYEPDGSTMFTYLRGRLDGPGFEQSRAALVFTRKAHGGQSR